MIVFIISILSAIFGMKLTGHPVYYNFIYIYLNALQIVFKNKQTMIMSLKGYELIALKQEIYTLK